MLTGISQQIWNQKYRLEGSDTSIQDTWRRVAHALSANEVDHAEWETKFYDALEGFKFIPAGRILAGADAGRDVTLFNCFVNGTLPDDMAGIYRNLEEAAMTMRQGGGIGYDFSTIRPYGSLVHGVAARASGPLAFMDVWNAMSKTVMSAGAREGAMMATMRCDHPDVEMFIDAKRDPLRLRQFNVSVLVTDAFMSAVASNHPWDLVFNGVVYQTVQARDLWNRIMQATYDCAEPGVIFIDQVNRLNNLNYCETIAATNPCGEQPLPPYGACLLGSINLAALVEHPYEGKAVSHIPRSKLQEVVRVAVRMLDNVVDVSKYPLKQQEFEAKNKRRIGLGITGLADALMMRGLRYGSPEAVEQTRKWMQSIHNTAYTTSAALAVEKGPFPMCDNTHLANHLAARTYLPASTVELIRKTGLRNSHLLSVAPTGTISLLADNVSSGIEPVFAPAYTRRVRNSDDTFREEEVVDYAVTKWRNVTVAGTDGVVHEFPPAMVTTEELTWREHLDMVAAVQPYIDSAISKTINLPEDISFDEFRTVYQTAYSLGLKGCTTYRPNAVTGSVLKKVETKPQEGITETSSAPAAIAAPAATDSRPVSPPSRGPRLTGATYKLRWEPTDSTVYLTINDKGDRPFEVLIVSKNPANYAWISALTLMISAIFRRDDDASFVADELSKVFDPNGGAWIDGRYVPSLPALIGDTLRAHTQPVKAMPNKDTAPGRTCWSCGSPTVHRVDGCDTCASCGQSKCG